MTTLNLVYGVAAPLPPAGLVVDTSLERLAEVHGAPTRCAELSDLAGAYGRIRVHVLPYTSTWQIRRDLHAAGALLAPAGVVEVIPVEARRARQVERLLEDAFAAVVRDRALGGFSCRDPRPTAAPEWDPPVPHHDPVSGRDLRFLTRPGIFSPERIDLGTQLLLATAPDLAGLRVLDYGCGYGAVGVIAAARGATVTMVDEDCRAVDLARRNLGQNGLEGEVLLARRPEGIGSFDVALSNPPTHAGSDTLAPLLQGVARVSRRAYFVVRAHLNYEKWLPGAVRAAEGDGYKVLRVEGGRG